MDTAEMQNIILDTLRKYNIDDQFKLVLRNEYIGIIRNKLKIKNNFCDVTLEFGVANSNKKHGKCGAVNNIYYSLGKLNDIDKKQDLLDLLNDFNCYFDNLIFYLKEYDSTVMVKIPYSTFNYRHDFDANQYIYLLNTGLKQIEEVHDDLTKFISL